MNTLRVIGFSVVVCGAAALPLFASAQYYYPYHDARYNDDVTCFPATQEVEEGEKAYFIAYGGDGDYDWTADGRTYRDRNNTFSHEFDDERTETVTVRSDGESDTCRVRVVEERDHYYYPPVPPAYTVPPVTVAATYIPKGLPNTGFPPVSSASLAFAAVMLLGVGLALTPYAKKAITATWR